MDSNHSLLPAPRQEPVEISREVPGVVLTQQVYQQLRRDQTYMLWAVFGATVFLNSLIQWSSVATLQFSFMEDPSFIAKLLQGKRLVYAFAPLLFGRLADAYSRSLSLALALLLFIAGSIICAASPNAAAFAAGTVSHTMGMTGIGLLATLFIADYTSLKWRGVALSCTHLPALIVIWAGPALSITVTWRWMYGMVAIVVFVLCTPALYLLLSAERNHYTTNLSSPTSRWTNPKDISSQMDLVGLVIFTLGFSLIEYSSTTMLTRRNGNLDKYAPGRIAMLVIGLILVFPVFFLWELYWASFPLMPGRVLRRKGVLFAILIVFLFQLAYAFSAGTLGDFIPTGWKLGDIGYLFAAASIAYTASAPLIGVAYYAVRRSKPFLIVGSAIFVVGCGLWLHAARYWNRMIDESVFTSKAYLFTIQVLIGIGGIAIDMSTLISSQAAVTHGDLAIATALVFAWSQIAASLGTLVAIAISLRFDLDRTKIIISLGLALGLSLLCLLLSLFVPNFILGDKQNAVEEEH
ncbi:unnamed protein product [Rhizoctonia solani]|uniref:Uncharacterized protein n=1 Tax=Rhizoctonia solani TaxID=456999 RepID=A0A8H3B575_9AGAM|nr:unnamed protein product [Rhizoctonia solani]